ncbi:MULTISPECIES: two-component system sensor histidine kinase KdpD [Winslowiella]|uniref:two-component system sensor histidine kinase KdpD n=1 Tax=Winslowiella TaxID=2997349 RepID=UPI0028BF12B3|nr:two-component system sensor histidine kinase KdpD [Winslowiella toletana]WNN45612.1 two-component system sensor histidine kinase KdpD [Winslowiella toletana]
MNQELQRPSPEKLLQQHSTPPRGKLKIFFGACAGVGKTFAMLQEGRRLREQGLDVLIGVVETHGRRETAALLDGLSVLPLKISTQQGRQYPEFDLDAALARAPAIILIDELAHSNIAGSRHPKRWQDVEELLNAGIDVFTTVNVQHLESLNDVVGSITGILVRETVPDPIFDLADEIVLVDLTPDDLRQRLAEGKVYIAGQAERAIEHFFRKGNLIALRELALRRTADRVDDQMRAWRDHKGREQVWHTRDAVLVCIGEGAGNEKLVRTAARLAAKLDAPWHAVYVETPRLHKLPGDQRRRILQALKLAQDLGAETATLSDTHEELSVLRYAREHDLGKIVIGRRSSQRWKRDGFANRLGKLGPDLDLLIVARDEPDSALSTRPVSSKSPAEKWRKPLEGCALAVAWCATLTVGASWLFPQVADANLVMLYLLGVVIVALLYGRWPSVVASLINVASFDLFFIAPRGTLAVSDLEYLLTFAIMLAVGIIIGNLTASMRYQARVARYREARVRQLYEVSRALSRTRSQQDIIAVSQHFIDNTFRASSELLIPDAHGQLPQPRQADAAIARWSFDNNQPAGAGTATLPGLPCLILPLTMQEKCWGLLVIEPSSLRQLMIPEQQRLIETVIVLIASALERLALTHSEEQARFSAESEQLRNSLLAALSHDLRTPLTVLFGMSEILTLDLSAVNSPYAPQANQIRQHIINTTRLVNNLLDMARIQSGGFVLRKEWLTLEEIIGSTLNAIAPLLNGRRIQTDLPAELLLVEVDGPLIERLLTNLLENAIKYAGHAAQIGIRARRTDNLLDIEVWDDGPGILHGQEKQIFDKFTRGNKESAIPGVGLGLAICQAIVTLHQGEISAENRPSGGASFHLRLPQDKPPELAPEEPEEM